MSYTVAIVLERDFGERLAQLAERMHVWVCATPENRLVAERCWTAGLPASLDRGVTVFNVADSHSPEVMLTTILGTVDLHHGQYSHDPPWDTLEIYGTSPTPEVRRVLGEFGVSEFATIAGGFRCSRPAEGIC